MATPPDATQSSGFGKALRATLSMLPASIAAPLTKTLKIPVLGKPLRVIASKAAAGEGVIKYGPASGLRIDASGAAFAFLIGTHDADEQQVLVAHLRPGGVLYDLGAHIGFLSLLGARLVGETGHVVAFEPLSENAAQLQRNVHLNGFTNVTVVEAAISREEGTAQLDTSSNPNLPRVPRLVGNGDHAREGLVSVRTVSIDGWRAETGFPPPDLVKIDVEGMEVLALRGAHETIRASRPVLLVEVHWGVGTSFADYFEQTLSPLGYRATSLTGGPMPLSDKRFHAVLVPERST